MIWFMRFISLFGMFSNLIVEIHCDRRIKQFSSQSCSETKRPYSSWGAHGPREPRVTGIAGPANMPVSIRTTMAPVKLILATDGNINEQRPVKAFDRLKSTFYFEPSKVKLIQVTVTSNRTCIN